MTHVPTPLITEIHAGNCVAFVGAGFSATVIPPWGKLLSELARSSTTDIQNHVTSQVRKGSAHALDEAAQVLQDHLGEDAFLDLLALSPHQARRAAAAQPAHIWTQAAQIPTPRKSTRRVRAFRGPGRDRGQLGQLAGGP